METPVSIDISSFEVSDGVSEYHVLVRVCNMRLTFAQQLEALWTAYRHLLETELKGVMAVFKRFFVSDVANQADEVLSLCAEHTEGAVSIVGQAPLDGSKIALWAYLQRGVQNRCLSEGCFETLHGSYRHLWMAGSCYRSADSESQTRLLLEEYVKALRKQGCTLADHCIRTWFFVQNVDVNYKGMVKARNEVFMVQNLTHETHFIASTGIEGRHANPEVIVQLDAYAIDGVRKEQIHHLYAPTHLNPTYEYGVSFERGTYVDYGDRRHVFISGTASINNRGEIMHSGDIRKQTLRMWENVEMLLAEAECTFEHVGHLIVYLRDMADYTVVEEMFRERFPDIPKVYVWAPVCRPGWLIEMECMAVKAIDDKRFPAY